MHSVKRKKKKICLILDKYAAYVEVKGLKAIKCAFLPQTLW